MLVPKTYEILERCVYDGVAMGYDRAFKHNDYPDNDHIKESINREVMNEICNWFNIKDEGIVE